MLGGHPYQSNDDRDTNGKVDSGHVGVYGADHWGAFYASGALSYDFFKNEEHRTAFIPGTNAPIVPVQGVFDILQGSFSSRSFGVRGEAGWRWEIDDRKSLTPFVALQYDSLDTDGLDIDADTLAALLAVDNESWRQEVPLISEHFTFVGERLPGELSDELAELEKRLAGSR